jgi:hypothetical protein
MHQNNSIVIYQFILIYQKDLNIQNTFNNSR